MKTFENLAWKKGKYWEWNEGFIEYLKQEINNGATPASINRAVGMDVKRIKNIAEKNNMKFKTHKNDSSQVKIYHSYDWCYDKYMVKGMNHDEMAMEAKCSKRVIKKWCCEKHRLTQKYRQENFKLSDIQRSIIIGGMLGDGHINRRETQPMYIESHANDEKDYMYWKYDILKNMCNKSPSYIKESTHFFCGDKEYLCQSQHRLCTRIYNCLKELREKSYSYYLKNMDNLSFSIWMLDDGYRDNSNWSLCVAEYTEDDIKLAIDLFGKMGLESYRDNYDDRYINFRANSSRKIDKIILKVIPNHLDIIKKKIFDKNPTSEQKRIYYKDKYLVDYCRENKINYKRVMRYVYRGASIDEAIEKAVKFNE